ncbi:MAG: heat-inducible transcriptional repressor HrcA [Oscillospiraceae bacterium]|jgi:heat-inducible transcriptional repressor|nr:heat-inducible transcriptional repressor HrcA [Oscillospiraceae bacterium]
MEMDERKLRILYAIIDDYILTAIPVGSRTVSKKYNVGGLSSATIRNEMSDLEALGYLDQPHTSSGRVPSAKAYRLYVESLLNVAPKLPPGESAKLRGRLSARERQLHDLIERAAHAVAEATGYTTVVTGPATREQRLRSIQIVPVSDRTALLIIVTDAAVFKDTTIRTDEGTTAEQLFAISRMLTDQLQDLTVGEIWARLKGMQSSLHEHARVMHSLLDAMGRIERDSADSREIAVGGGSNILQFPEYSDANKARTFLNMLEAREELRTLMTTDMVGVFTLRIGAETGIQGMEDCAMITSSYTAAGEHPGAIGVIGPVRMRYGHVLSVLEFMTRYLSEALFMSSEL